MRYHGKQVKVQMVSPVRLFIGLLVITVLISVIIGGIIKIFGTSYPAQAELEALEKGKVKITDVQIQSTAKESVEPETVITYSALVTYNTENKSGKTYKATKDFEVDISDDAYAYSLPNKSVHINKDVPAGTTIKVTVKYGSAKEVYKYKVADNTTSSNSSK